jgi:hypothetical protein
MTLQPEVPDSITSRWSASSSSYSTSSAYSALFLGQTALRGAKEIWKAKAPREFKFFLCLAIQDRVWTAERRQRHGLESSGRCALYDQLMESIDHLTVSCVVSREVWFKTLRKFGWQALTLMQKAYMVDWWLAARKRIPKARRKAFDSLVLPVCRSIWLQRNAKVFRGEAVNAGSIVEAVSQGVVQWCLAGIVWRPELLGRCFVAGHVTACRPVLPPFLNT